MTAIRINKITALILLALILLMTSCNSSGGNNPASNAPGEIKGVVLDSKGNVVRNKPMELARVAVDEDAAQFVLVDKDTWVKVLGMGMATQTDSNGAFVFTDVPPGEYVLLIYTDAIHSLQNTEGTARFVLSGGETLDVGQVSIWNP